MIVLSAYAVSGTHRRRLEDPVSNELVYLTAPDLRRNGELSTLTTAIKAADARTADVSAFAAAMLLE